MKSLRKLIDVFKQLSRNEVSCVRLNSQRTVMSSKSQFILLASSACQEVVKNVLRMRLNETYWLKSVIGGIGGGKNNTQQISCWLIWKQVNIWYNAIFYDVFRQFLIKFQTRYLSFVSFSFILLLSNIVQVAFWQLDIHLSIHFYFRQKSIVKI